MMAAFYTFKEDSEGIISSYEMFNKTFHDLNTVYREVYSVQYSVQCTVYREVTSQDLVIGDSVQESCRQLERRMQEVRRAEGRTPGGGAGYVPDVVASNVALDKEVAALLKRLNLSKLNETFAKQELTHADVLDLDNDDLIAIGVPLVKDRKAILKEITKMKNVRGDDSTSIDEDSARYSASLSSNSGQRQKSNETEQRKKFEDLYKQQIREKEDMERKLHENQKAMRQQKEEMERTLRQEKEDMQRKIQENQEALRCEMEAKRVLEQQTRYYIAAA